MSVIFSRPSTVTRPAGGRFPVAKLTVNSTPRTHTKYEFMSSTEEWMDWRDLYVLSK